MTLTLIGISLIAISLSWVVIKLMRYTVITDLSGVTTYTDKQTGERYAQTSKGNFTKL